LALMLAPLECRNSATLRWPFMHASMSGVSSVCTTRGRVASARALNHTNAMATPRRSTAAPPHTPPTAEHTPRYRATTTARAGGHAQHLRVAHVHVDLGRRLLVFRGARKVPLHLAVDARDVRVAAILRRAMKRDRGVGGEQHRTRDQHQCRAAHS
jgi:hypothetical protein